MKITSSQRIPYKYGCGIVFHSWRIFPKSYCAIPYCKDPCAHYLWRIWSRNLRFKSSFIIVGWMQIPETNLCANIINKQNRNYLFLLNFWYPLLKYPLPGPSLIIEIFVFQVRFSKNGANVSNQWVCHLEKVGHIV